MRISTSILILTSLALFSPVKVHAIPTDFNADKQSDLILVEVASDSTLTWNILTKSNQVLKSVSKEGSLGDHLVPAPWNGKTTSLGYITQEGESVRWSLSKQKSFYLGKISDTFLSGGDFDGDKKSDAVAIKKDSRALTWSFVFDPLKKNLKKTDRFGKPTDIAFFMNLSGKKDVPAIIRGTSVLTRDISKKKISKIALPFEASTRPLPVKQKNNKDALSFISKSQGSSNVKTVNDRGILLTEISVPSDGETIVGDFTSEPGEEIAFQTSSGFYILNPFTQLSEEIQTSSGIPVDEININSFSSDDSTGGSCTNETRNPKDGGYGFLWKPKSDSTGKLAIHIPSSFTGKVNYISVITPSGEEERGANGGVGNGDRYLGRFSKPGSSYPNGSKAVIYLTSGCTVTYVIANTSVRVD